VAGLGEKGLRLAQPCVALEVMRKSLAAEAARELAVDLRQEATVAISMVCGKRTKVVTTETILAIKDKPSGARAHKSSHLKGPATAASSVDKAKKMASEQNLDTAAGKEDFFVLDLHSDARLSSTITDSCVVFVLSAGSPSEALSVLRAKEQVQAALAEVAIRLEKEKEARAAREAVPSTLAAQGEAGASFAAAGPPRGGEARVAWEAAPSSSADQGETVVSVEAAGPSREMVQASSPRSDPAMDRSPPRVGGISPGFPSPRLGRPRGTRVTRSVTRSMLAMCRGKGGKGSSGLRLSSIIFGGSVSRGAELSSRAS
jgi:hypothetical protein